ncbi:hypothetical protein M427DRAFT_53675 [Gonapodya prolifera JEL478]|uniref:BTB domain-containing protein n=1 Tax=Gonapodya prolifera (strain JEL478) TaxID=1344416 RepID=A0A139AQ15_GONPJ|nr:hypothetical protein M427DRAFT_53675 [Gonapodya prolifera JEL478]|eukprot:KXS18744.1 hypothetical protein M427DRAFT_53675 [Gonapodya prolifera JEL478]
MARSKDKRKQKDLSQSTSSAALNGAEAETERSRSSDFYSEEGDLIIELDGGETGSPTVQFRIYGGLLCTFSGFFRTLYSEKWSKADKDAGRREDHVKVLELDDDPAVFHDLLRWANMIEGFSINDANYAGLLQLADKYDIPLLLKLCVAQLRGRPLTDALDNILLVDKHVHGADARKELTDMLVQDAANQVVARAQRDHDGDFRCVISDFSEEMGKQLIQAISASHGGNKLPALLRLINQVVPLVEQKEQNATCPSCNTSIYNPYNNFNGYGNGNETIAVHFIKCLRTKGHLK